MVRERFGNGSPPTLRRPFTLSLKTGKLSMCQEGRVVIRSGRKLRAIRRRRRDLTRSAVRVLLPVAILFVAGGSIASVVRSSRPNPRLPAVVNKYCAGCHNTKTKVGELHARYPPHGEGHQHPEEWEKVIRKLRPRYMPPVGLPRPDEKTYDAVIASLQSSIDTPQPRVPTPDAPTPSAASTASNIRTPCATCSHSTST